MKLIDMSKKNKLYAMVISVDIFFSEVIVLIINSKKYLQDKVEKVFKEDLGMLEPYAQDYSNKVRKALEEEEDVLPPGVAYNIAGPKGSRNTFVVLSGTPKTVAKETIIHEMCHATQYIMEEKGINDNETEAYLLEYLCHGVFEGLADLNKKDKKS